MFAQKYPAHQFTILSLQTENFREYDWQISNLVNHYLPKFAPITDANDADVGGWNHIFEQFPLQVDRHLSVNLVNKKMNNLKTAYDVYISLGNNSEAGLQFKRIGYEESSFFRFINSPYESTLKLIENDFRDVYLQENLMPVHDKMVKDKKYNITFHSNLFSKIDKTIGERYFLSDYDFERVYQQEQTKTKYFIQKWHELVNSDREVLYILKYDQNLGKNNAAKLLNLLTKKYPKHKFTLLCLQLEEYREADWGIPNLVNDYLPKFAPTSKAYDADLASWNRIFTKFPLKNKISLSNHHRSNHFYTIDEINRKEEKEIQNQHQTTAKNHKSLTEYPKISCFDLNNLPVETGGVVYTVEVEKVQFDFFSYIQPQSPYLYVWLPGAVDRSKHNLPVFHRWSWLLDLPHSGIVLNDPTLYLGDLNVGWFLGDEQQYYLPLAVEIVKSFIKKLNLQAENVMFLGSSAGGFAAMMMAGYIPGSSVVANNPQTDVFMFDDRHVQKLLDTCFTGRSKEELKQQYAHRFSVSSLYESIGYVPNIYYVQNIHDRIHIDNHYLPFINSINVIGTKDNLQKYPSLHIDLYSLKEAGHNPLVKHRFMKYVDTAAKIFL